MTCGEGAAPRRTWVLGVIALLTMGGMAWTLSRGAASEPVTVPVGSPALLDFGMDVCVQCKKTRQMLERLRPSYEGRVHVQYVDVRDEAGSALAETYGMRVIPLLVLLDAEGREVWRHEGLPEEALLRTKLDEAVAR